MLARCNLERLLSDDYAVMDMLYKAELIPEPYKKKCSKMQQGFSDGVYSAPSEKKIIEIKKEMEHVRPLLAESIGCSKGCAAIYDLADKKQLYTSAAAHKEK